MNKKDYCSAMEKIAPKSEKKEEVWNKIMVEINEINKKGKEKNRVFRYAIIAASFLCVAILFGTSVIYAENIQHFFSGWLGKEKETKEYVQDNVCEIRDEHIRLQVKELLFDGVYMQSVVQYEALDEQGKRWMELNLEREVDKETDTVNKSYMDMLSMGLYQKDESGRKLYMAGNSLTEEIKQYRTEKTRYYYLMYRMDEAPKSNVFVDLNYCITQGSEHKDFEVKGNVPVYEYNLKPKDKEISKYFNVKEIRLTQESYVVYGNKTDRYKALEERLYADNTGKTEETELRINVYFLKKDGSRVKASDINFGGTAAESKQYNYVVVSGIVNDDWNKLLGESAGKTIVPEEIVGIQLERNNKKSEYLFCDNSAK